MTAVEAEPRSRRRVPGEEGLWVFLLGDMGMFALLFGMIVVLHRQQPEIVRAAQEQLHPELGMLNTVLLLTGSLAVVWATRTARTGAGARSARLLAAAVACGFGFGVVKSVEYTGLIESGYTPQADDFFMYYFVITGIHLAHLVIGVVLLAVLALRLRRVIAPEGMPTRFTDCAACYWHLVDLLWLVLFPLFYLVR